jgi:hypothetical protein
VARLPQPGGDNGTWGDVLNDYLSQALTGNGLLKDNAVTANTLAPNSVTNNAIATDAVNAAKIADGSISEVLLDGNVQTKLNATGDWGTLANKPTVIGAGTNQVAARIASGAVGKGELVFNVLDYGAVGNGTTDDTAAIQAADVAALAAGVTLLLGPGTYAVGLEPDGEFTRGRPVAHVKMRARVDSLPHVNVRAC